MYNKFKISIQKGIWIQLRIKTTGISQKTISTPHYSAKEIYLLRIMDISFWKNWTALRVVIADAGDLFDSIGSVCGHVAFFLIFFSVPSVLGVLVVAAFYSSELQLSPDSSIVFFGTLASVSVYLPLPTFGVHWRCWHRRQFLVLIAEQYLFVVRHFHLLVWIPEVIADRWRQRAMRLVIIPT